MDSFEYFPATIYREERPDWVGYTLQVAQKYYDNTQNNEFIMQTEHMAKDPNLKFLVDYLLLASKAILEEQGYDIKKYEFYISGLWGQNVGCNGKTNVHVHKNSQISGWFFLETPKDGSYPVFYDPRMNKPMVELDSIENTKITNSSSLVHFNNVRPGTFLFANSWLQHQLTQNNSFAQTKSIHFVISHREHYAI